MRRVLLVLAMASFLPSAGSTCVGREAPNSAWLATYDYVARVRLRAIQDVAETPVGEAEVLEELKGTLAASTVYVPLPYAQRPEGEPLEPGDTGFLFASSGADYRATRTFWADVDALRKDAPLIDGDRVTWLSEVDGKVAVPAEVVLALGSEQEPHVAQGERTGWYLTPARSFALALGEALALETTPSKP